jgi:hypothetical protein
MKDNFNGVVMCIFLAILIAVLLCGCAAVNPPRISIYDGAVYHDQGYGENTAFAV